MLSDLLSDIKTIGSRIRFIIDARAVMKCIGKECHAGKHVSGRSTIFVFYITRENAICIYCKKCRKIYCFLPNKRSGLGSGTLVITGNRPVSGFNGKFLKHDRHDFINRGPYPLPVFFVYFSRSAGAPDNFIFFFVNHV